jgi:Ca-activated chloride channel homolog
MVSSGSSASVIKRWWRRGVATALPVALGAAMPAPSAAPQAPIFRAGVDLVNVGVTVTGRKGALVTSLNADDFEVYEDGKKQVVRYFAVGQASGADEPGPAMHLGLLLDVSESMEEEVRFTRTAAVKFLNTMIDAVDVTLVDFDTEVRVARYGQQEYARLIERIRRQKASGHTALYDAIGVYLDGADEQEGRTIMLLYTDGADTHSVLEFSELVKLLKASDVTVYVVGQLEHQSALDKTELRRQLQEIADITGGRAFFPRSVTDLDAAYEQVVAEIRAQYILGYLSTNEKLDGSWRKIDVKVVRRSDGDRGDHLRFRRGYYAAYDGGARPRQ